MEIRDSHLVQVVARSDDPELAALIANSAAKVFVNYWRSLYFEDKEKEVVLLESQLASNTEELNDFLDTLEQYKEREGILDLDMQMRDKISGMSLFEVKLRNAEADIQELIEEREVIQRQLVGRQEISTTATIVSENPVVVDLKGLRITKRGRPVLREHNREAIVGHTTKIDKSDGKLAIEGVISGTGEAAGEVASTADNGFPWRVSIGAMAQRMVFVQEGATVNVNGRDFKGPVYVARRATLGEVSFVTLAADDDTTATVAASDKGGAKIKVLAMDFEKWLKGKGWNLDELTDAQRVTLEATYEAETKGGQGGGNGDGDGSGDQGDGGDGGRVEPTAGQGTEGTVQATVDQAQDRGQSLRYRSCQVWRGRR